MILENGTRFKKDFSLPLSQEIQYKGTLVPTEEWYWQNPSWSL